MSEGRQAVPKDKIIYISASVHRRLKLLSAQRNRSMGQTVEELVDEELAELANPWISPEGAVVAAKSSG